VKAKFTSLTPELYDYVRGHASRAGNPTLARLRAETEALGEISQMLISEEQGNFITLLVAALGAKSAIEVGTFTGYSSTCIALGLPADGRLLCVDQSAEWTSIARRYWKEAGVEGRIELRLGDGADILRQLGSERFDFAFIDADKTGYDTYFELILPRMRDNGLLIFDNMLSGGRIIDPNTTNENARALHALNEKLARDHRVESVLLSVADGLNLCRKKSAG
jgi:caffeoyl-CoA O-methyltransferase